MKIFAAVNMNWGLHGPGDWDKTEYTVYDDGKVMQVIYIGTDAPTVETTVTQMPPEFFEEFRALLDKFNRVKPQQKVDACDGEGWSIKTFGAHGKILNRFNGYIYGIKLLADITGYLP